MPLVNNINSQYFGAANSMRPKSERRRIVVYVEGYDDVFFWRSILSALEDENRYFEIMLPTQNNHLGRGKKCVLKMLKNGLGRDMIACVDADYDYLVQGQSHNSKLLLETPFVFHTYAYAIENWQCYAPSLQQVSVMVSLNDSRIFDFQTYLSRYSEIVYPLFLWSVWLYRTDNYQAMTMQQFDQCVDPGKFKADRVEQTLNYVRDKVVRKVRSLSEAFESFDLDKQIELSEELQSLGITPKTTYLYIHGHPLFEHVVTPMMTSVCERLRLEREWEIRRQAVHKTQMNNELASYSHSVENVTNMLRKNTGYLQSPIIQRIISEIQEQL